MGLQPGPGEELPPLEEIVAFASPEPVPHWHYISYGLTELDAKTSDDPTLSGWGFELTMRVAQDGGERPMVWPLQFMRWIAMTLWRDQDPFGPGHSFLLPKDMLATYQPHVHALAFVVDDALGRRTTVHGDMTFLQIVGLHEDEYQLLSRWDANKLLDAIAAVTPRLSARLCSPRRRRGACSGAPARAGRTTVRLPVAACRHVR